MLRASIARALAGSIAVAALVTGPTPGRAETNATSQSRERVLYVSVYDAHTRKPVLDLGPDAFVVREDGTRREVLRVTRASSPMPLAVLVDNSEAASGAIADLRRALVSFLRTIDGIGPLALITVADRPTIVVDYTTSAKALLDAAGRLFHSPGSGATLLDGIAEVAKGLMKREADRAGIVVVTTENLEFSPLHYSQVLDALHDSGASLHAVVLTSSSGSLATDEQRNRAAVLAIGPRQSGGLRLDVLTSMAFERRLGELATILKSQHRVVYARPDSLVPPERVELSIARPGLAAQSTPARGQAMR